MRPTRCLTLLLVLWLTSAAAQAPLPRLASRAWVEHNDHWYAATEAAGSFEAAEGEALSMGGHLVTIDGKSETAFLLKSFAELEPSPWIGLGRRLPREPFTWTSGAGGSYSHWAPGEPAPEQDDLAAKATLILSGESAGLWVTQDPGDQARRGIIELEFDPAADPLADLKRSLRKANAKLKKAREACFVAADKDAKHLDLETLQLEFETRRAEGLATILASPLPTNRVSRAASNDVQTWIHATIDVWGRDSKRLRSAIVALQKAHTKVLRLDPESMGLRALLTDIFCALLDREEDQSTQATRSRNLAVALQSGLAPRVLGVVQRTNEHRQLMGLPLLQLDGRLGHAAQVHADEMLQLDFFAHDSPVEGRETPSKRLAEVGLQVTCGECIGRGANPVAFWSGSAVHHALILAPNFELLGAGIADELAVLVLAEDPTRDDPDD